LEPINIIVGVAREYYGRIPLAVASGGTQKIVRQVLEHLNILKLFQAIVTSEDVTRQKPAPDIYLEAARRIGVAPEYCRAYEDTDIGLTAIRAAGMQAVDVRDMLNNAGGEVRRIKNLSWDEGRFQTYRNIRTRNAAVSGIARDSTKQSAQQCSTGHDGNDNRQRMQPNTSTHDFGEK